MEVMNGGEFEETSVLIGQAGKTQGFGVSADPMLMSMLSTGLYANPLRTMLQEIMFNAWDAHRMGNCQDKPIDVYLNDTTGLIVRDYGPGIAPQDMHPIYCIYGNSTKRDDKGQTGGFGLGSKSPYAYTESFTVSSLHKEKKFMYLMKRVSEENKGGPGMTPLIEGAPTDETGLIVTVPMKNDRDRVRAYEYIQDILVLSGIKVNLHFEGKESETIYADSVAPGQYVMTPQEKAGQLYAIYGGVRYTIQEDDAYREEYRFLSKIGATLGGMYIGFAPDTLTPLPNREGLNLSEKSVETIKSQLETMVEAFKTVVKPALRAALDFGIEQLYDTGIQPHFLAYRWKQVGTSDSLEKLLGTEAVIKMKGLIKPAGISTVLWESMVNMAFSNTYTAASLLGQSEFRKMRGIVFVKKFPEWRKDLNYLTDGATQSSRFDEDFSENKFPKWVLATNEAIAKVVKAIGSPVDLRINQKRQTRSWIVASGVRGGKKIPNSLSYKKQEAIKKQLAKGTYKPPEKPALDRLWSHADGKEVISMMMFKHIIVAKTATALNESDFKFHEYFAPNVDFSQRIHYHPMNPEGFRWRTNVETIPAIVVHDKKGNYDTAISVLKSLGYRVIEADEPYIQVKDLTDLFSDFIGPMMPEPKKTRHVPSFPVLNIQSNTWTVGSAPEITDPDCYFCCTLSTINGYSSYDKPSSTLLHHVSSRWPKTALLHNKQRESILIRKGVPLIGTKIDDEVEILLKDKERVRRMFLHMFIKEETKLPPQVLESPEVHKLLKVPYIRSNEKLTLSNDWGFLHAIKSENSEFVFRETKDKVKSAFAEWQTEPSLSVVRAMCKKTQVLDKHNLRYHVDALKPGELKTFNEKLIRFIRTI